ncbi:DHA2 family efflux MFS transporter permease subunit [Nocardia seriolae]|uniref:Actinorhodin transporter n=1 Tax=Nocardia seriolae TaxID=37332 RepID=A0ABC8AW59_9NOCA|nr:DHA2 family efflux MFS transporter permease subunit [Nocardia seriolae]APA98398.1 putative actinorhodin transporter [Nocardia seriolae]OJF80292.1 MFS transporter [Nocardia seriolae]PSK29606.1 MFS transporter [Nocardia seriolae]QOW35761.1 DHA2 family efflux MFS transporter permease subunit [Nocardia seriolae]QUN16748.1 DHA2 family efflux MFS transporter permease subunit [Nocardia seriolae]
MKIDPTTAATPPRADRTAWIGLGVLAAGLSMIVVDGTIVGVALPVMVTDLGLNLTDAQWVNSAYSVVFAALLLTAGRLGDRLGRRRMFVLGVLGFLAGSVLAALASSAGTLILSRVVQGIGGAFVLPATLSSVNATFRGKDRVVAFAVWGAVISGMAAVGPLLGGTLTTYFSWRWIFLVNIPIGAAVLVGAWLAVRETRAAVSEPGLDVDGLLLSAIGFGGVIFALIEGQHLGWWRPNGAFHLFGFDWPATAPVSVVPVIGLIGVVALVLFVVWERHRARVGRSAILDVSLFSVASFSWGNLTALTVAIGEFGLLLVLPLFLVNALGLSTLGAGLVLAAMALGAFASGAAARHLAALLGPPKTVIVGLALEAVGVGAVALSLSATISPWLLAVLLAGYGAGLGLASAQLTGTVLADIPPERSGQGSATQSTVRQLGAALGSAILGAVLSIGLAHSLTDRLDAVDRLPAPAAQHLVTATRDSAGGMISALRAQGDTGPLGPAGPHVATALSEGFADATRAALGVAAVFLALGLVSAIILNSRTRRTTALESR